jgi:hypothetical protein
VLFLLGLSAVANQQLKADTRRRAFIFVALGILLVAIPLGATTFRVYADSKAERTTKRLVQEWIGDTNYEFGQVDANGNQVKLVIHGSGDRPALAELGTQLSDRLKRPVEMTLIVVPSEQEVYVAVPE